MKLWILRPVDMEHWPKYDAYHGFVIQASDERQARSLADATQGEREYSHPWLDPTRTWCKELVPKGLLGKIIMEDFHAG